MTKMHMTCVAELVKAILDGEWTNEPPTWAKERFDDDTRAYDGDWGFGPETMAYTRAVQTAEAFLLLFKAFNDRFDEPRFLVACGLAEKPTKKGRK